MTNPALWQGPSERVSIVIEAMQAHEIDNVRELVQQLEPEEFQELVKRMDEMKRGICPVTR